MIATPTISIYGPNYFLNKVVIKTKCQNEKDWVKFLEKKSSLLIRWDYYRWKRPPPLSRSPRSDHMFLVGLRRATFYKANRLLRQFQYEKGMPGGRRRKHFVPIDTTPTSIRNMLLGFDMGDRVDQTFVKVHFHTMILEYSK